jgi:gamma-tubulin complex component 2
MVRDEYYVTMRSTGELKLERSDLNQSKAVNLLALAKCTLVDPTNPTSTAKEPITCMQKVAIKSSFGHFIKVEADGKVSLFGQPISDDSTFRLIKAHVPLLPDWLFQRPHLSRDPLLLYQPKSQPSGQQLKRRPLLGDLPKTLGQVAVDMQEQLLLQDLLYVMMGIDGTYIRRKEASLSAGGDTAFDIEPRLEHPTCDSSLLYLTTKLVQLGSCYEKMRDFLRKRQHFEYGYVCHAMCGAVDSILKEYMLLVTQLDTLFVQGSLTLQKLWFFVQPTIRVFTSLAAHLGEVGGLKGGGLLSWLYRHAIATSEPNLKKMMLFILEKGLEQYVDLLAQWLYEGIVEDPFEEFMIKENVDYGKESVEKDLTDSYWKYRFVVRDDMVPSFLGGLVEKILITGKYLHVIRECRSSVDRPFDKGLLKFKLSNPAFIENPGEHKEFVELIHEAHEWSCQRIVKLLFEEEHLTEIFVSIKRYFFMEVGDLFAIFLESSQEILESAVKKISQEKLESLFEMAVRISSASNDVYKEDLACELSPFSLADQMYALLNVKGAVTSAVKALQQNKLAPSPLVSLMGIEAFCLDYKVKWPLSIILSRRALTKYKLIFRHLFFCKSVEMQLESMWQLHQTTKELDLHSYFVESHLLRNRMLHFCKNYLYYMMADVLEPKWHKFKTKLPQMKSLDEVLTLHNQFLDECLKECLLSDPQILNILTKTFQSCSYYFTIIKRLMQCIQIEDQSFAVSLSSNP